MSTITLNIVPGGTAWAGTTTYYVGQRRTNDTSPVKFYQCTTGGTSAGSGGPTGTGSSISDGTCVWEYLTGIDCTSFASFNTTVPANMGPGNSYVGQVWKASNPSGDTQYWNGTSMALSGHSTTSSSTITIKPAPGDGFRDNANVLTNALCYNPANGLAFLLGTVAYTPTWAVADNYVTIFGMQINQTAVVAGEKIIDITGSNLTFDSNICDTYPASHGYNINCAGSGFLSRNNLYIIRASGSALLSTNYDAIKSVNDTFVCPSDAANFGTPYGVGAPGYVTSTIENATSFGLAALVIGAYRSASSTQTCCTDKSSTGANTDTGSFFSKTYANQFVGTTIAGGLDFRLKSGADCIDAATTDTTDIPSAVDIIGTTRPQGTAWCIGAWEFASSSSNNTQTPTGCVGTGILGTNPCQITNVQTGDIGSAVIQTPSFSISSTATGLNGTGSIDSPSLGLTTLPSGEIGSGNLGIDTSQVSATPSAVLGSGTIDTPIANHVSIAAETAVGTPGLLNGQVTSLQAGEIASGQGGICNHQITELLTGLIGTGVLGTLSVGSSEVTLLTGLIGTGVLGTLSVGASEVTLLFGIIGTGVVGTLGEDEFDILGGITGVCTLGTLFVSTSVTVQGIVGIGSLGTLSDAESPTVTLIGMPMAGVLGSLILSGSIVETISGVMGAGVTGTVIISETVINVGDVASGAVGVLTAQIIPQPQGIAASGKLGAVVLPETGPIVVPLGLSAIGLLGTDILQITESVSSVTATASTSSLVPQATILSGESPNTISLGVILLQTIVSLSGQTGTGTLAALTSSSSAFIILTSVSATASTGSIIPQNSETPSNLAASAISGVVSPQTIIFATGIAATIATGMLLFEDDAAPILDGSFASGDVGFLSSSLVAPLISQTTSGQSTSILTFTSVEPVVSTVTQNSFEAFTGILSLSQDGFYILAPNHTFVVTLTLNAASANDINLIHAGFNNQDHTLRAWLSTVPNGMNITGRYWQPNRMPNHALVYDATFQQPPFATSQIFGLAPGNYFLNVQNLENRKNAMYLFITTMSLTLSTSFALVGGVGGGIINIGATITS